MFDRDCCVIGRIQESLANYNIALKLNPSHSVSLVNMARQLRGAGNIREAEQAYKRFERKQLSGQ